MNDQLLDIATADGAMETFIAYPDGDGPFPAVVIYMDAPGIREELYGFARRIASEGYLCALPDLYYRRGRIRFDIEAMTRKDGVAMFDHMESLTVDGVVADSEALLAELDNHEHAGNGPRGCIGYCMSGRYVMGVAGRLPARFHAAVSCYGVGIVTESTSSPHLLMNQVEAEMLFAFAEHDSYVPDTVIPTLQAALDTNQVAHDVITYPGTEHGFCFPERVGAYVEDAAEDVWRRTFEMFERRLRLG